jgi:hypothetical protein
LVFTGRQNLAFRERSQQSRNVYTNFNERSWLGCPKKTSSKHSANVQQYYLTLVEESGIVYRLLWMFAESSILVSRVLFHLSKTIFLEFELLHIGRRFFARYFKIDRRFTSALISGDKQLFYATCLIRWRRLSSTQPTTCHAYKF